MLLCKPDPFMIALFVAFGAQLDDLPNP